MVIYTMNCSVCHGTLDKKPSPVGKNLFPHAPQLIIRPLDDPEWRTFYVVKHGISRTGMPAWGNILSEDDMWKVTAFLSNLEKLPPEVQQQMPAPVANSAQ
jgi:mono/diheme cytochrome c family protein